jgi:hypothetical protein
MGAGSTNDESSFWVVSVDRATWRATTSELIVDAPVAWQLSLDLQNSGTYTTVVPRRPGPGLVHERKRTVVVQALDITTLSAEHRAEIQTLMDEAGSGREVKSCRPVSRRWCSTR